MKRSRSTPPPRRASTAARRGLECFVKSAWEGSVNRSPMTSTWVGLLLAALLQNSQSCLAFLLGGLCCLLRLLLFSSELRLVVRIGSLLILAHGDPFSVWRNEFQYPAGAVQGKLILDDPFCPTACAQDSSNAESTTTAFVLLGASRTDDAKAVWCRDRRFRTSPWARFHRGLAPTAEALG